MFEWDEAKSRKNLRERGFDFHNGQPHDYVPDFIVRLKGEPAQYLILETKGFDPLMEVKQQAAMRWVNAVNGEGSYGQWFYAIARKPEEVKKRIEAVASIVRIPSESLHHQATD